MNPPVTSRTAGLRWALGCCEGPLLTSSFNGSQPARLPRSSEPRMKRYHIYVYDYGPARSLGTSMELQRAVVKKRLVRVLVYE